MFLSSYLLEAAWIAASRSGACRGAMVVYGLVIHAVPVIVANVIVAGVAMISSLRSQGRTQASEPSSAIQRQA